MTLWSRWLAGAMLSTAVTLPAWGDAPSAAILPPAPMPDGPAAPTLTPIPSHAPVTPYYAPSTTLAPATQAWADQAYPASPGGYPAYSTPGAGPGAGVGPFWAPGGYEPRIGSPYYYHDPNGGQFANTGNPYDDHYGPGFHRHSLHGHYRFPYYTYRAPWYYPGRAVYNRDTNQPW
ncbi:MAG: hypothetical protein SH850_06775 [Planctomycetaceae bacterium]|nr:hypothetical protein [Planctomycetaceae bacterium]